MAAIGPRWPSILQGTSTALALFDASRRIRFWNDAAESLTGLSYADVAFFPFDFAVVPSDARPIDVNPRAVELAVALAPPPEAWAGFRVALRVELSTADGARRPFDATFIPLSRSNATRELLVAITPAAPVPPPVVPQSLLDRTEWLDARREWKQRYHIDALVCRGAGMQRVARQLTALAQGSLAVLMRGEAGSGKELAARILHQLRSPDGPFIPIDCQRLAPNDASQLIARVLSNAGSNGESNSAPATLYLAQFDFLPRDVQPLVISWLSSPPSTTRSVHIVAGSDAPRDDVLRSPRFLPGLVDWLSTFLVEIPPLRERRDDLRWLAIAMLQERNSGQERQYSGFTEAALTQIEQYDWPGNGDELRRCVDQAAERCTSTTIDVNDLPLGFRAGRDLQQLGPAPWDGVEPLETVMARVEKDVITSALRKCRGSRSRAAELLGVTRATLYRRIDQLGIGPRSDAPASDEPSS